MGKKSKQRYEVWFAEDPFYMTLRERTVLFMIKSGSIRHTPIVGYCRIQDGVPLRGPDDPLMTFSRRLWHERQDS
ncbi:hypothetical protein KIKIMORA_00730 [Brevundimonas phage vB_BpoS-Kikimora]|uniref:Uncharacterized protein n=1 Tax=Brevundimonas phage vB_BpoS-Kikimora TaxID=2948601 RepID=A0A9E7SL58_9CAUD|nr:hypothetical protein KIKIMORA_00730 [Brevundimonas phage vB_BpoS-Kikimora]